MMRTTTADPCERYDPTAPLQPGMSGAETLPTEEGLAHGGPVALANAGLRIPSESAPDIDRLR